MQEAQLDSDRIRILIAEYRTSKASAETHLSLIWQATNIMWAANMVLIGFVVNAFDKPATIKLVPAIAIFAIVTLLGSTQFTSYYRTVAKHEYTRCQEIEGKLRMSRESIIPSTRLHLIYLAMNATLIAVWVLALIKSMAG